MDRIGPGPGLAEETRRLFAAADALGRSVDRRAAAWDRNRALDPAVFEEAAAIGLTGIEVPKYLGGLGLGFREKVRVAEILGRYSMGFAFAVINTQNVAARLAEHGGAAHKRDLLPELLAGRRIGSTALTEPGAGSDFAAIATQARPLGEGWLLTGEKAWITNATVSDVIICYAQTEPGAGGRGIAGFVVDGKRPGFIRSDPFRLSGSHLIGTGGFRLDGYQAEADDLLTPPGDGFRSALRGVNGARIYVAALCCSMVHAALTTAVHYGAERRTFGRPLLEHQGLAWSLASVANRLEAARLLTDRAIDLMDGQDQQAVMLAAAHAKKFATEMAEPAIAACIQAMGAEGLRDDHALGRHLADARVANFVDGSTEIQTDRIARSLLATYRHPAVQDLPPEPDRASLGDLPPPPATEMPRAAEMPPAAEMPGPIDGPPPMPPTIDTPLDTPPPLPPPAQFDPAPPPPTTPLDTPPPLPPPQRRAVEVPADPAAVVGNGPDTFPPPVPASLSGPPSPAEPASLGEPPSPTVSEPPVDPPPPDDGREPVAPETADLPRNDDSTTMPDGWRYDGPPVPSARGAESPDPAAAGEVGDPNGVDDEPTPPLAPRRDAPPLPPDSLRTD
ncbi:MAG: acyl-CoA dehydrogenase family protein [Actinomycetota bacterium]